MKNLFKILVLGIALLFIPSVMAEEYKVLVVPDNIVTDKVAVDSYIYDASAEFFASEIVSILNATDYIKAPQISDTRDLLKKDISATINAKNFMNGFRTSYNIDYTSLKKIAAKTNSRYVLLLTSYIDAENYILRRTFWDFLNIPGASVIDPAYKISTYAVLVDTKNNTKMWSDTYYKTISTCENRIITRGPSPQVQQLEKIKDYSRYLCPQVAQNVQAKILPPTTYLNESQKVYYDMGNIDNVFTKKYRHLGKEVAKVYRVDKKAVKNTYGKAKKGLREANERRRERAAERKQLKLQKKMEELERQQAELEVKAQPIVEEKPIIIKPKIQPLNEQTQTKPLNLQQNKQTENKSTEAVFKKPILRNDNMEPVNYYTDSSIINIKKTKKNNLYDSTDSNRPILRDYN